MPDKVLALPSTPDHDPGLHMNLILRRAALSRKSGEWSDDDYDVFDGDRCVGRIFFEANRTWYWGLTNVNGAKNRGNLATLADAKAAFRAAYEAWLTEDFTERSC